MGKIDFNVDKTKVELNKLKNSRDNIEIIINDIQKLYNSMDDTVWLSKEKKMLDGYINPYLETSKKVNLEKLDNYNETLDKYVLGYENLINKISQSVNNERGN